MIRISAPVGPWEDPAVTRSQGNRKLDVEAVQKLLAAAAIKMNNPLLNPGRPDGLINRTSANSATLKAIFNFQKSFMAAPDRRVDPNGGTLRRLNEGGNATAPVQAGLAMVRMTNQGSTRSMAITTTLSNKIGQAVGAVFGAGAVASVYSGGQPAKGTSTKRVGSVRHDLGHAADLTIVLANGSQVGLAGMERLGQWWLAKKMGCVGVGMQSGRGIHLDEWSSATGPALAGSMGKLWKYDGAGPNTLSILNKGLAGQLP